MTSPIENRICFHRRCSFLLFFIAITIRNSQWEKSFHPSICSFILKSFEFVLDKCYQGGQWDNDSQIFPNFAVTIYGIYKY